MDTHSRSFAKALPGVTGTSKMIIRCGDGSIKLAATIG